MREESVTVTVIGTSDLHGHIEVLPVLGGFLGIVRAARARDGGGVLLVDGGDMFQGTLESNLGEGEPVVEAYNALGYRAAAIGNHELDFGQTALQARAAQARFPFLAANLLETASGRRVGWPNVEAGVLVEVAGVSVGLIGVTTEGTAASTAADDFAGLATAPLAATIAAQAAELRGRGARVVVVAAHAGGKCSAFADPDDLGPCAAGEEIFEVARALPAGAVDVIVAGHTHFAVAHRVNGIAVIQSYAQGRAFGRVDLSVPRRAGDPVAARIFPPRDLCAQPPPAPCAPGEYEGQAVEPDARVAAVVAPPIERARARREAPLGVVVAEPLRRAYGEESPLGNLLADLMRQARPRADVAMINGGGLRADLAAGPLTYGALFEVLPFDNRFAAVRLSGAALRALIAANLAAEGGFLSLSGVRAHASCKAGAIAVELRRASGRRIGDREVLTLVTNDFLALGKESVLGRLGLPDGAIAVETESTVRDALAELLRRRGGELRAPAEKGTRIDYPGPRPLRCPH